MTRLSTSDAKHLPLPAYYTPNTSAKSAKPLPVLTPLDLMYAYYDAV